MYSCTILARHLREGGKELSGMVASETEVDQMSEVRGIYTLWKREVLRFIRERTRLISSVVTPILWLIIFGTGLGLSMGRSTGYNYQEFIFPGIIGQTLLFTAMFMGISVIWDKQFGFMKEILVAPIRGFPSISGRCSGQALVP